MKRTDLKAGDKVIVRRNAPSRSRFFRYDERVPTGGYHEATVIDPKVTFKARRGYSTKDVPAVEIEITGAVAHDGRRGTSAYTVDDYEREAGEDRVAKIGERVKVEAKVIVAKAEDHARELAERKAQDKAHREATAKRQAEAEALAARYEAVGVEAEVQLNRYTSRPEVVVTESPRTLIEKLEAAVVSA